VVDAAAVYRRPDTPFPQGTNFKAGGRSYSLFAVTGGILGAFEKAAQGDSVAPLIFIEFNEINFDFVRQYAAEGKLLNLRGMIERHGVSETTSEESYSHLEPWIQWVTAHTGKPFDEHKVFRLGDFVNSNAPQIWEQLEHCGLKVGAISPMNAANRVRKPAFFVPDPWTPTDITARPVLVRLYRAIVQAVNDNAQGKLAFKTVLDLLSGFAAYAAPASYTTYARLVALGLRRPWYRAMFLDLLLADVFIAEQRRTKPDFATLFLNAGAHIQHHYMFSASPYRGPHRNPEWYVKPGNDPVFDVYNLYDQILGRVMRSAPEARFMLATGLHQNPQEKLTFYWRLRAHDAFLRKIGVPFVRVDPRMSRDFLVTCDSPEQARLAADRLSSAVAADGIPLFEVDNRGIDLFVMLTYPREIAKAFSYRVGSDAFTDLDADVAFVAIKNGEHNGIGYFIDSGVQRGASQPRFPLADLPSRIASAFDVRLEPGAATG